MSPLPPQSISVESEPLDIFPGENVELKERTEDARIALGSAQLSELQAQLTWRETEAFN